jgi:hypothetical protein
MAPKIMQIHARSTLVPSAKLKNKIAPKYWQITKLITSAEQDLKLAPKNIWIQNLITSPKSNSNLVQIIDWINDILESAELKYKFAPKRWQITKSSTSAEQDQKLEPNEIWIQNLITLPKSNTNWVQTTVWIYDILKSAEPTYNFAPKCRQILKLFTSAGHNLELVLKNTLSQPIHVLNSNPKSRPASDKITLTTRIVIHKHNDSRIKTDCNKPTAVITESYYFTIMITAAQPSPTKILIQTFFFIIHPGTTCTTDERTNWNRTTKSVTGGQNQHSWQNWQTLMNVVPTPGKAKTTLKRDDNRVWKGRLRETKGTKGTKERGMTMKTTKTYKNDEENQKKIIIYIFIDTFSCIYNIPNIYNIYCNVVDIRLCTQDRKKEIKCRLEVDGKGMIKGTCSLTDFNKLQTIHTPLYVETRNKSTLCVKKVLRIDLGKYESIYRVDKSLSTHLVWEEVSISKLTNFNYYSKLDHSQYNLLSKLSKLDILHTINYIKFKLMNDIESNPGPGEKLKIVTFNCRGLGEIDKFRLLLNKAYDMIQKN